MGAGENMERVDGQLSARPISLSHRIRMWQQRYSSTVLLLAPLLLYMSLVFAIPIMFQVAFGFYSRELYKGVLWRPVPDFTLDNFVRVFSGDEVYLSSLLWTVGVAFFTSAVSITLSLPVAYFLARYNPIGRSLIELSFLLPVFGEIFTLFALAYAFAPQGPINWVLMGLGLVQEPIRFIGSPLVVIIWMSIPTLSVLLIRSALVGVDVLYEEAAQTMGANTLQTFAQVTFPLAKRGIMGALLLSVSSGVGVYTLPLVLVGPYNSWLANKITREVNPFFNYPMASALGVILTAVSAVFLYLYLRSQEAGD
ncbi:MAG: ABC transporter permease [Anaerolineae bacterium]|nr:ABC transporter permease [Anaerolineae bacterium]